MRSGGPERGGEGPLDDRWVEFPMIDRDRVTGRTHSMSWAGDIGPTD